MLVHEAAARLEGRPPRFGDAQDREAALILALHSRAVAKATRLHTDPKLLEATLRDLQQFDRITLEAYLHPALARSRGRTHGR